MRPWVAWSPVMTPPLESPGMGVTGEGVGRVQPRAVLAASGIFLSLPLPFPPPRVAAGPLTCPPDLLTVLQALRPSPHFQAARPPAWPSFARTPMGEAGSVARLSGRPTGWQGKSKDLALGLEAGSWALSHGPEAPPQGRVPVAGEWRVSAWAVRQLF